MIKCFTTNGFVVNEVCLKKKKMCYKVKRRMHSEDPEKNFASCLKSPSRESNGTSLPPTPTLLVPGRMREGWGILQGQRTRGHMGKDASSLTT